jgi:hypothetical protein
MSPHNLDTASKHQAEKLPIPNRRGEMKLIFALLLFAASALAQQPNGGYGPATTTDLSGYSNVPTCDPKYEYVGVVVNENLVAENRCLPQQTLVTVREWDELRAQVAALQERVHELEASTKENPTAAPAGNKKVQTRERK